jgi:hypothetical protein
MTPAKMFDGDLWMLASDAVAMAENAYKKGQTDEREACAALLEDNAMGCDNPLFRSLLQANAAAIRAMGKT